MKAIIFSLSSDIGLALARHWEQMGWEVFGTVRTPSAAVRELNAEVVHCDLAEGDSIDRACAELAERCGRWDLLVLAAGTLEPIGKFDEVAIEAWERSLQVNLMGQLRAVHRLLPLRNQQTALVEPAVLFFAGGGTNAATLRYSSYTLSKIALIKMCELLDAEIPDTRFVILGPGYVKTKIHEATFAAKERAGESLQRLLDRLAAGQCTAMEEVVASCHWLLTTPCRAVRGRNFSTAFDRWGTVELEEALQADSEMYKLRRSGNGWRK